MDVENDAWAFGLVPASRFLWGINSTSSEVSVGPSLCFDGPRNFLIVYIIIGVLFILGTLVIIAAIVSLFISERKFLKEKEENGEENTETAVHPEYQNYEENQNRDDSA